MTTDDIKSRIESGEWVLVAAVPVPPRITAWDYARPTPDPDHAAPQRSTKHRDPEWSE